MNLTANRSETQTPVSASRNIRVVLVEDMREVREGLAVLINGTSGFNCLASYRTMEEALAGIIDPLPDVILTDIGLAGIDGIEGTRILRELLSRRADFGAHRLRQRGKGV